MLMLTCATAVQAQKYVGGDISLLTKYEEAGVEYKNKSGNTVQPLTFFHEQGLNAMRVRLFVDPSKDTDKAVCQDLEYVKALGKRIKDAGMSLMIDFHYSDTWADPGKQWTPDAWKSLSDTQLYDKIYEYTKDCLAQLKAAGAEPDFIQTGNEISYGMLWGTQAAVGGNSTNRCYTSSAAANWTRFFNLLKKAGQACREECPKAKIVLHSERVPKPNVLKDFFDRMKNNSIDYDIIGLSYYPDHHGSLATLETALNTLENKNYGKEIMIVEAGYSYQWAIGSDFNYTGTYPYSEEGQRAFTADLIAMLNKHRSVTGLFWWWMEDNGNKSVTDYWWNASLYNHNTGQPYAAFYELAAFVDSSPSIDPTVTDYTSLFQNMDFESCQQSGGNITDCPGWTIHFDGWKNGPWPVAKNEWHSSLTDGLLLQGWCEHGTTLSAGTIISQQQENMPTGTYTVSAIIHTDCSNISLFANNDMTPVAATSTWGTAYEVTVTTTLTADGPLTLGLTLTSSPSSTNEVNLYADNFKVKGITTSVPAISTHRATTTPWYSITGQRLSGKPTTKGIYIADGKKVIVR